MTGFENSRPANNDTARRSPATTLKAEVQLVQGMTTWPKELTVTVASELSSPALCAFSATCRSVRAALDWELRFAGSHSRISGLSFRGGEALPLSRLWSQFREILPCTLKQWHQLAPMQRRGVIAELKRSRRFLQIVKTVVNKTNMALKIATFPEPDRSEITVSPSQLHVAADIMSWVREFDALDDATILAGLMKYVSFHVPPSCMIDWINPARLSAGTLAKASAEHVWHCIFQPGLADGPNFETLHLEAFKHYPDWGNLYLQHFFSSIPELIFSAEPRVRTAVQRTFEIARKFPGGPVFVAEFAKYYLSDILALNSTDFPINIIELLAERRHDYPAHCRHTLLEQMYHVLLELQDTREGPACIEKITAMCTEEPVDMATRMRHLHHHAGRALNNPDAFAHFVGRCAALSWEQQYEIWSALPSREICSEFMGDTSILVQFCELLAKFPEHLCARLSGIPGILYQQSYEYREEVDPIFTRFLARICRFSSENFRISVQNLARCERKRWKKQHTFVNQHFVNLLDNFPEKEKIEKREICKLIFSQEKISFLGQDVAEGMKEVISSAKWLKTDDLTALQARFQDDMNTVQESVNIRFEKLKSSFH